MSVEGENFTDRELECRRLKLNFENGINSILISPRRMGKTSLVKKVKSLVDSPEIKVVYIWKAGTITIGSGLSDTTDGNTRTIQPNN